MNKKKLTLHLQKIGIRLQAEPMKRNQWTTSPSSRYPFPTTGFRNLKEVERHWKHQALQRLVEVDIAERAWKEASNDTLAQMLLLRWAEGKSLELPKLLKNAISSPSTPPPKSWRHEIERLSDSFGDASTSWLHEAIIRQATSTPACL